ncbi:MAG TPA: hypothetical protein PL110_14715, partial [Candidatus Eremiobacteraeota bacterium]|nr:hypothetical protein [Candidatus Eremiobacteraeota bacterium]
NGGEKIAIILKGSTEIKYAGSILNLNDIREGDVIKVKGTYVDRSVMADKIEVISRVQSIPVQKGIIHSITHNATYTLKPGNVLKVTMNASSGGGAYFDITNLAFGIPMKEITSGKYEGTYTVLSGDRVENTTIVGHLVMPDGSQASVKASKTLNIGFSSVEFSTILPKENSVIDNTRPNILIIIQSNSGNKGIVSKTVRLKVNGKDVTSKASISDNVISYVPSNSLPKGLTSVNFTATDINGNQISKEWSFNVQTSGGGDEGNIYSVTHNGQIPLHPGDKLVVTMVGTKGGKGTFDIGSYKKGINMKEDKNNPGVYTGEYAVTKRDSVDNLYIYCYLQLSNKTINKASNEPLVSLGPYYSSYVLQPEIIDPKNGDNVNTPFIIRGNTRREYKVEIKISYVFPIIGVLGTGGELQAKVVMPDDDGYFEHKVNLPVAVSGTKYTIKAVSIDKSGKRSSETIVTVTQK